jgi:gliding motility-associated-like protein
VGLNVLEWSISTGGCTSTSTLSIQVDNIPTLSNAGTNQTICASSPNIILSGNTALVGTGTWALIAGSGTIVTPTLATSSVNGLGLGVNIFEWTISNGICLPTTSTVSIQVDLLGTPATASPNQTICITSSTATIFGNTPTIGIGSWSLVSGTGTLVSALTETTNLTNLGPGINVFAWTISNGGCSSTSTVSITVDTAPTIANAGPNQSACINSLVATMSANTALSGIGTWSLVSGSGNITNINFENTTITNLGFGVDVFVWTIANSCSSSSSTVSISIDQAPTTAIASPNQSICITSPTTTISGNIPTIGVGTWSLVLGSGTITSASSPTTTLTNIGIGNNVFAWEISNGVCAPSVSEVTITVEPLPTLANAGVNQTVCVTSSALMSANYAAVGTGSWSVISGIGTITSINSETTSITNLGLGNNVFAWTISSNCGSSVSNVTITVDQVPTTAIASANQSICVTSPTASISGNLPVVGVGTWSLISGSGTLTSITSPTTTITNIGIGTNIFAWMISNGVCAASTSTTQVTVNSFPTVPNAGSNQTVCVSNMAIMNANSAVIGSGLWSVIAGGGIITTPTLGTTSISGLNIGNNIFGWTIGNSCSSLTSTVSVFVDQLPSASFAGIDQNYCLATSATLNATNPLVGVGNWSVIAGGGSVSLLNLSNSLVTGLTTGTNALIWAVSNGVCNVAKDTVSIFIDALPTKANAGLDLTTCSTTTLLNGNTPVIGNGVWYVIGGGGSVATAILPNTSVSGLTTPTNILVWSITNGVCPSSEDTVLINILPPTVPAFAGNDTIISVGELTLYAINPTSGNGSWSIISGVCNIANTSLNNTSVTGLNFGLTTLEWSITDVCGVTKDEVNITYVEEILPNSFSPNGDGTNDSFDIPYVGSYKTVEIKILNRWGNIVYEDVSYKNNWFGTNKNGEPLSEDTYFYLIKLNNKIKNGYITIKR